MSPSKDSFEFDFLRESLKDFKEGQIRLEDKLDLLRADFSEDVKELRSLVDTRFQPLNDKLYQHEQHIQKHGQLFNVATFLFTTCVAGLSGFIAWLWELTKR